MKTIRKRLTYANVASTIALFLVVGGATAFAALGKNTVGTKQLKKNAVTTVKIKRNAINTAKLRNEAVAGGKIRAGAVSGNKLANGSVTEGKLGDGAVTGGKLADGSVTTAKIGNDAVTGAKVDESTLGQVPNAKTLDGIGTSAFSRQASSSIANNALVGKSGTAREVNITAPQDGFLLAIGSADVFGSASNAYECEFELDGAKQPQSQRESELGTENLEENCTTNAILAVKAGTHNVKFNFINIAATTTVDETELDVVFIPFAG